MFLGELILAAIAVAIVVLVILSIPDIARYIRINRM